MDVVKIIEAIFSIGNLPVSVLLVVNGALLWQFREWRIEVREDNKALVEALTKNTEMMQRQSLLIAAVTGKAP